MKLSEWVDECKYIAEQTEPFARGWGPNRAAMLKTIELQARREHRQDDWKACKVE